VNRSFLITIIFASLAAVIIFTPLQHYMTLSRMAHYGTAVFVFGIGYLVQMIVQWKKSKPIGRFAYGLTSFYYCSAALVLIANPWMDPRSGAPTDDELDFRKHFIMGYFALGLAMTLLWLRLSLLEYLEKKAVATNS
jgi:ABC-type dipeptide/oligopeptide/nickel transport system permease component